MDSYMYFVHKNICSLSIHATFILFYSYHTFEITQTLCNFIAFFFLQSFPSFFFLIFYKVDFQITLSLYKEKGRKGRKEKRKEGREE